MSERNRSKIDDIAANILAEYAFKTMFDDLSLKFYFYMGHTIIAMN